MAEFPYLRGTGQTRTLTEQFAGLERRDRAAEGAVRAGRNLSARALPALTPGDGRKKERTVSACTDLIAAHGRLIWTSGGRLYVDGIDRGGVRDQQHQLVVMGKRLILFPEKKYLELEESTSLKNMESSIISGATFTDSTISLGQSTEFRAGDGVTISGCIRHPENNKTAVIREVNGSTLTFSEECFTAGSESAVTIKRKVPDLDFVCEKDNRLWGVHDNAICCSVLGDPCNWMVYEGLATDGWETEVGTDGAFTGIAAASSHVLCFKEDCVHKIYGAKPSNFQVQVSQIPGVQSGCERSVRNVGEIIYWWARDGLMAYGGGIPDRLSAPLGDTPYTEVRLGAHGHTLWLSGQRAGKWETLTYDIEQGAFLPVDGWQVVQFAEHNGALYLAEADAIWRMDSQTTPDGWEAVFGPYRAVSPTVLTALTVLADCTGDCTMNCAVRTQSSPWKTVWAGERLPEGRVRIPIRPERGMQFWLRLRGKGRVMLQGIRRTLSPGEPD